MKNYYQILGVPEDATQDMIKNAFKQLAIKNHPDKKDGDLEKMKDISEAYDTLKDSNKRQDYDNKRKFGTSNFRFNQSNSPFEGMDDIDNIFQNIFGVRRSNRNSHINIAYQISLEDAFTGKKEKLQITDNLGNTKSVEINVPPGVEDGNAIRFPGLGENKFNNITAGDLIVRIHTLPHDKFERTGPNLHLALHIDAIQAMIGDEVEIETIDNKKLKVTIPRGIQNEAKIRIPKYGMPIIQQANSRGDLFLHILIDIPKLNDNQIEAIKNIKNIP